MDSAKNNTKIYKSSSIQKQSQDEQIKVNKGEPDHDRRDFLALTASALTCVGAACAVYPLVSSMGPAKDTLATSTIEVDLKTIPVGTTSVISWRGKPVFIRHRTAEEIMLSLNTKIDTMKDPELDSDRTKASYPQWLILVGICTHLGCIPSAKANGWFCPCHGSQYDLSGRIVYGPAPKNMEVPPYKFINNHLVQIG